MKAVLLIVWGLSWGVAVALLAVATSSVHETVAGLCFVNGTVAAGAVGVIGAIADLRPDRVEKAIAAEKAAGEAWG